MDITKIESGDLHYNGVSCLENELPLECITQTAVTPDRGALILKPKKQKAACGAEQSVDMGERGK